MKQRSSYRQNTLSKLFITALVLVEITVVRFNTVSGQAVSVALSPGTVRGLLKDSVSAKPVEFATVALISQQMRKSVDSLAT